jgi:hypothetical protein
VGDGAVLIATLEGNGNYLEYPPDDGFGVIDVGQDSAEDSTDDNGPVQAPLDAEDGQDD